MSSKMILVFCDGTGNDGLLAEPHVSTEIEANILFQRPAGTIPVNVKVLSSDPPEGGSNIQYATNVLRLSRAVKSHSNAGKQQLVFYQSGVGSAADFLGGNPEPSATELQALGTTVASKIRDAYAFIAQNFEIEDEICIFGFSRGAYSARKLAGLIDRIGLLSREHLGLFFGIWRQLVNGEKPTIPPDTRTTRIKCVGVWDTVGSVANTIDALHIKDNSLPPSIDIALHAVSLQENRKKFLPTLWEVPADGLREDQVFKQMWFPGAHSDVGGGYERHELADLALFWMAGEVKDVIELDLAFLQRSEQPKPDPWGSSQPHNAYEELVWWKKPILGHKTRLEDDQITSNSSFHESINFSPTELKDPRYMVTLDVLKQTFGSSWTPTCPPLNEFEQECKNHWGKRRLTGPPVTFEKPLDLFPSVVRWASGKPGAMLPNAIAGGKEDAGGPLLYVARAHYRGGLHPGKAGSGLPSGAAISFKGKEINVITHELLIGSERSTRWVNVEGIYSDDKLGGAVPVTGGWEEDGTALYVAQAPYAGGIHCGKTKNGSLALIPYCGKEINVENYHVLAFV